LEVSWLGLLFFFFWCGFGGKFFSKQKRKKMDSLAIELVCKKFAEGHLLESDIFVLGPPPSLANPLYRTTLERCVDFFIGKLNDHDARYQSNFKLLVWQALQTPEDVQRVAARVLRAVLIASSIDIGCTVETKHFCTTNGPYFYWTTKTKAALSCATKAIRVLVRRIHTLDTGGIHSISLLSMGSLLSVLDKGTNDPFLAIDKPLAAAVCAINAFYARCVVHTIEEWNYTFWDIRHDVSRMTSMVLESSTILPLHLCQHIAGYLTWVNEVMPARAKYLSKWRKHKEELAVEQLGNACHLCPLLRQDIERVQGWSDNMQKALYCRCAIDAVRLIHEEAPLHSLKHNLAVLAQGMDASAARFMASALMGALILETTSSPAYDTNTPANLAACSLLAERVSKQVLSIFVHRILQLEGVHTLHRLDVHTLTIALNPSEEAQPHFFDIIETMYENYGPVDPSSVLCLTMAGGWGCAVQHARHAVAQNACAVFEVTRLPSDLSKLVASFITTTPRLLRTRHQIFAATAARNMRMGRS